MKPERVVPVPHLPKGKVGCVIIGERYRERLEAPLLARGVRALWIPDNPDVDPRLCGHVDLSLIHMSGNRFVGRSGQYVNILTNKGLVVIPAEAPQTVDYPGDAGLNGCIVGSAFIHNTVCTDKTVLRNLGERKIISVNQGYAKCSVCVLNEHAIITSDSGIAAAATKNGIDVLKICPGHIALDGFGCGFIGGSTWKLSANELAFTGSLETHPDRETILVYLSEKGIMPIFLTGDPIFDIGSAIPIFEA